jgi:HlyD family secretion protein
VVGIQNAQGSTLMTLADMSIITAEVKVDETDIVNVKLGQPADVTVDAVPGKTFKGHVTEVGDQALLRSSGLATSQSTSGSEEAKDFKVVVTIDEPSADLRPGLSTTAKITTAKKDSTLAIPIQALTLRDPAAEKAHSSGKKDGSTVSAATASAPAPTSAKKTPPVQGVYVLKAAKRATKAEFVPVTTGITGATDIEVTNGLKEGDEIVIGSYKVLKSLKSGTPVKRDTSPQIKPEGDGSSS